MVDQIDTQILQQLQQNAKISMKELAAIVHLSSPAVIERVKKLEEQGVIEGYHAKVNIKKMERTIQAIILFHLNLFDKLFHFRWINLPRFFFHCI